MSDSMIVGEFLINPALNQISCKGKVQILEPKVMELLVYLANNANVVLSRQRIMADVWQIPVTEGAVNRVVGLLRKALNDDVNSPRYIQTIAKQGYRLIADVAVTEDDKLALTNVDRASNRFFKWCGYIAGAICLMAYLLVSSPKDMKNDFSDAFSHPVFTPITSEKGFEYDATLSADEQWLVYRHRSSVDLPYNLFLKKINQQQILQLTDSALDERSPAFSHDQKKLVFFSKGDGKCQLNLLYLTDSGEPLSQETLYQCGAVEHYSNVVWAVDDQSLFFTDRENSAQPYQIFQLDINTLKLSAITNKEENYYGDNELALSPSGQQLLFFRNKYWGNNQVFVKNLITGEQRKIAELGFLSWNPSWTPDEQQVLFSDNRSGGTLKLLTISDGNIQTLYQSINAINSPELSSSATHIVYSTESAEVDIWQQSLNSANAAEKLAISSSRFDSQPVYSNDGKSLLFLSNRNGFQQLWLHKAEQLAVLTSISESVVIDGYHWSPDGTSVVAWTTGKQLLLINPDINSTQVLDLANHSAAYAVFANDGMSILFASDYSGDWQLWRYQLEDKQLTQLTAKGGYQSAFGLNDEIVYFTKYRQSGIWQLNLSTMQERLIVPDVARSDNFSVCGYSLYYLKQHEQTELWQYHLVEQHSKKIKTLAQTAHFKFDITNDCKDMAFSKWSNIESDIMMMSRQ